MSSRGPDPSPVGDAGVRTGQPATFVLSYTACMVKSMSDSEENRIQVSASITSGRRIDQCSSMDGHLMTARLHFWTIGGNGAGGSRGQDCGVAALAPSRQVGLRRQRLAVKIGLSFERGYDGAVAKW
jgi:hypothetical protein